MKEHLNSQKRIVSPHISVDCVLLGFDGEQLNVLLVRQMGAMANPDENEYKLPGSLIYEDEDLDDAAKRVLTELTGLKNVSMMQFQAFGSVERTRNPRDTCWLERFHSLDCSVNRIVTIAYFALLKIDRKYTHLSSRYEAKWTPVDEVGELAFDHNRIVQQALVHVRNYTSREPEILFNLLPRKFTAAQLRTIFELMYGRDFDVRNFHKRIAKMDYVMPLEEREEGVAHRAARYYRFDRVAYHKRIN